MDIDLLFLALGGMGIFAGLSAGMALALHIFMRRWSPRKRMTWAAACAALVPMIVPFAGFLLEGIPGTNAASEVVLGFLALLVLTLLAAMIVCLPAAWFATSRLEREGGAKQLEAEGPALIGPHR